MTEHSQPPNADAPLQPADRPSQPFISVVCPVFQEEDSLQEFHRRATTALTSIQGLSGYELVFVNDGSTDRSRDMLADLCANDPAVVLVDFSRNFGHQLAITAGIDHARGDAVITLDTDLQDPPELIGTLIERWREGWDVVYAQRTERAGEPRLRLLAIHTFYRIINRLSETPLPLNTGDFRLIDRRVVDLLRGMREENRYLRGLVAWVGFNQVAVQYERDPRFAGESNYGFFKLLELALDGLTSFSERPLRFASMLGGAITVFTAVLGLYVLVTRLAASENVIEGYTSLMIAVLFFGGLQLLGVGLIGEYIGRIYRESKERPLYVVREVRGQNAPAASGNYYGAHAGGPRSPEPAQVDTR